ncbi:MAG TPA: hypothetical protein VFR51_14845 [Pyrinomonadaceae bacterium]|nr:hypothetical protein [Pyrinomonadaceae bacterium]
MTELFENFEVNRDSKASMLLKLLVASLLLHLALVWAVVYVPAVRDTVNIAALIANTKWVDEDYTATEIGSDVQIVQLEKFRYPDGYFALESQGFANPAVAAANDPFAPKIISQWKGFGPDPEETPSPSPEASPSASPSASASASPAPSASPSAATAQAAASPSPSPLTKEEAQTELEKLAAQNNVTLPDENQINKKPLKDLAVHVNDLKNQGKLDLNKPFKIVIVATLDEKSKLQNPKFVEQEGDEILNDLFGRMVAALNDSGTLIFLTRMGEVRPGTTVRITLQQGEKEVLASLESEATSPADATAVAKKLNLYLYAGALTRSGKDEEQLMKNTTATPNGSKVVLNFSMPRQTIIDMLKKQVEPPKPGV